MFLIVAEWFLIVILTKAYQKTEVLNQNPMKIPSEPIRKERICQNLTEALGKSWDVRFTIAKQTPPKKKYGGPPFTIVDVTLEQIHIHNIYRERDNNLK